MQNLAAKVIVASGLLSATFAPEVMAQSTALVVPPSGTASMTAYQITRPLDTLSFGEVGSSVVSEMMGITHNKAGQGPFHNMPFRCLAHLREASGIALAQGECVQTDTDGDQIFLTFEDQAGSGTLRLTGGTGKYDGIRAESTYSTQMLPSLDEGSQAAIIEYELTWQLQ